MFCFQNAVRSHVEKTHSTDTLRGTLAPKHGLQYHGKKTFKGFKGEQKRGGHGGGASHG